MSTNPPLNPLTPTTIMPPISYTSAPQAPVIISGGPGDPTANIGAVTGAWDHKLITYALTSGGDFNGPVDAASRAIIEQAFNVWNNTLTAAGAKYTLVEATNASSADIKVGWGTNAAGQLQQTVTQVYQQPAGSPLSGNYSAFATGTQIRLEDPSQLAIDPTTGTYQGTTGTLLQAAEQAIGYAIGLSASTDPMSVMNPTLGSQNLYTSGAISDFSDGAILNLLGAAPITSTTVLPPVTNYSRNESAVY